jgi:hypothetical protein
MKLYTVVVHNLQMCMKEYRCCLAYKVHGRTDWPIPIYPPNFVCGGGGITKYIHQRLATSTIAKNRQQQIICFLLETAHMYTRQYSSHSDKWSLAVYTLLLCYIQKCTHYLQMCMKEYGCCPKFKWGDNSTYTFMKRGWGMACTL